MGRLEAEMVRSLKSGAGCAAHACGLISMKKRALVPLDFISGRGFVGKAF